MTKQEYNKLLEALWTVKEYCMENHCDYTTCELAIKGRECELMECLPKFWDLPERKVKHDR